MGSKRRIAKEILPIILKNRGTKVYVEPFCGGLNTLDKVDGKVIASDNNKYLIEMWKGLKKNLPRPYTITKSLYSRARNEYNNNTNLEFSDFLIGWIGWMASYNGRFFDGGYSGHSVGKNKRNYINEQICNTEKQIKNLSNVNFICSDFYDLNLPNNSLIYCDIPYKNTKKYSSSKNFNYDKFWNWCRKKALLGHEVFISEYEAPKDFCCIWSKKVTNSINTSRTYHPVEKLFKPCV